MKSSPDRLPNICMCTCSKRKRGIVSLAMNPVKKVAGAKVRIIAKNSLKSIVARNVTKDVVLDLNPENVAMWNVWVDAQDLNNLIVW